MNGSNGNHEGQEEEYQDDMEDVDAHYIEEEEVYEDYGEAAEYIEVDGRLVAHVPNSAANSQNQNMVNPGTSQYVRSPRRPGFVIPREPQVFAIRGNNMFRLERQPENYNSEVHHAPRQYPVARVAELTTTVKNEVGNTDADKNGYTSNAASAFMQARNEFYAMKKTLSSKTKTKKRALPGQRKPCNCTKSQCLKLYCDCFANGEFCRDCNCKDCHNNMEYDEDRTKAIKQSLERNPHAFKPKIGIARSGNTDIERLHQKGCHCKKSGCLKNYCECYEAKVPCTNRCKCKGCQNTESDRMGKYKDNAALRGASALMSLANVAASAASASDSRPSSPVSDDSDETEDTNSMDADQQRAKFRFPWFYMTDEVIEAATLCMVAQAEDVLNGGPQETQESDAMEEIERLVLHEFGHCMKQIIGSSVTSGSSGPPNGNHA